MDWKTLVAGAGIGAGALWLAKSKKEESLVQNIEVGEELSGVGDDGLPKEAPMDMKTIFKQVLKSANRQSEHGEGSWSIHWSIARKPDHILWSVGDDYDRFGFIYGIKKIPSGKRIYIFQDSGGNRIKCSFSKAKEEALELFDEAIEYPAY